MATKGYFNRDLTNLIVLVLIVVIMGVMIRMEKACWTSLSSNQKGALMAVALVGIVISLAAYMGRPSALFGVEGDSADAE